MHVEGRVWLAVDWQSVFLVTTAHDCVGPDFLQDCRNPSAIGIHLHRRPRIVFRPGSETRILSFDADKIRIAGCEALPIADSGVVAAAGRNYKICAVAPKAQLRQRALQIRPSIGHDPQARHIPCLGASRVMADDTFGRPDIAAAASPPSRLFRYFEAGA